MPEVSVGGVPKGNTYRLKYEVRPPRQGPWWTLQAKNQELRTPFVAGVECSPLRLSNYRRSEVLQA